MWAAGAAVAQHVAKQHGLADLGVVTPYRAQSQLIRSAMMDLGAGAEVGTKRSGVAW